MNKVETDILEAAQEVAPNAPIVQVAAAIASTAANPSPANILADMELAIKLVKEFRAAISKFHPSVLTFIKKAL